MQPSPTGSDGESRIVDWPTRRPSDAGRPQESAENRVLAPYREFDTYPRSPGTDVGRQLPTDDLSSERVGVLGATPAAVRPFPLSTIPPFWLVQDRTVAGPGHARGTWRAISEFPKGRKYLISLSFRGKASVRPAQVGGFDVNIVIHGSTAVRGRGDLVAYRWALWKLTAPWTHRTRPPHLGKRCAFSTSSTGPFPSNHSRKTPKGPKIALGNPDRPTWRCPS